jgi:hypothetical protein
VSFSSQFIFFVTGQNTVWYDQVYDLLLVNTLSTIWGTYMKLVTKYQISAINSCWEKCDEKWAYMFNVYKNQQSRQTGSRNLMDSKTLPTIWGTYMKLVTKSDFVDFYTHLTYICICTFFVAFSSDSYFLFAKERGYHRWALAHSSSCLPNIRFLSSIVAEKNVTKNVHICSMCIKTN